ncbi:MAG: hypothetical protein OXC00_12935, partial [Acidimicrobiaceae bacterium]|nr:hypothetical protein [Acidimicrobiaceae bacterium]
RAARGEAPGLWRRLWGGGRGAGLRQPATAAIEEVAAVATAAIEAHLERRLRSVTVLDRS